MAQLLDAHAPAWHETGMKPQAHPDSCEVKVCGDWRLASLNEVIKHHQLAWKRCRECHGKLVLFGAYAPGMRSYLAHHRKHDGCSLLPDLFCGTPSPHPKALP
jgi:hypothetical protein